MRWILALAAFSLLSLPRTVFAEEGAGLASKDLVGAWDTATTDTKIHYDVQADGRYVRTVKVGWNSRQVGGTWRVEGDTVTILVDGDDEKITFRVRKVDDQNLDFWLKEDDQDEDATVRRWVRHDPDAKEPTPLDGRWELEEEDLHWSLSLAPDGAYVFHRETRGNTVEDRGVWKALPGALTLMKDGKEDGLVHFNLRRLDDATLELTLGIRAGVPKTWKKGGDRQPPIVNDRPATRRGVGGSR